MMYTKKGERDDEYENSSKDTPCTDMVTDSSAAPCVQACVGHRDLYADDRLRAFARVQSVARHYAYELKGAVASAVCRRRSDIRHTIYRPTS